MKNYVQAGSRMPWVVSGANIVSGRAAVVGAIVGVAQKDAIIGESVDLVIEGVVALPKAVGAISQGVQLYYDPSVNQVTITAGSLQKVGFAHQPALSADTTVAVYLAR